MPKRKPDHQPQRTCAVCHDVHPKRSMTRVVRGIDGSVSVDPTGRAAGRGTYLCDSADCRDPKRLAEGIQRALSASVAPDQILAELTHASA